MVLHRSNGVVQPVGKIAQLRAADTVLINNILKRLTLKFTNDGFELFLIDHLVSSLIWQANDQAQLQIFKRSRHRKPAS